MPVLDPMMLIALAVALLAVGIMAMAEREAETLMGAAVLLADAVFVCGLIAGRMSA